MRHYIAEGFFGAPTNNKSKSVLSDPFTTPCTSYEDFLALYNEYWEPSISNLANALSGGFIYGDITLCKTGDDLPDEFPTILYDNLNCRAVKDLNGEFSAMMWVDDTGFDDDSTWWYTAFDDAEKLLGKADKAHPYGQDIPDEYFWTKMFASPMEMSKFADKIRKFNEKHEYQG